MAGDSHTTSHCSPFQVTEAILSGPTMQESNNLCSMSFYYYYSPHRSGSATYGNMLKYQCIKRKNSGLFVQVSCTLQTFPLVQVNSNFSCLPITARLSCGCGARHEVFVCGEKLKWTYRKPPPTSRSCFTLATPHNAAATRTESTTSSSNLARSVSHYSRIMCFFISVAKMSRTSKYLQKRRQAQYWFVTWRSKGLAPVRS